MKYSTGIFNKIHNRARLTGIVLILAGVIISGCEQSTGNVLPAQGADIVVERFYEYISEAKITGGATPLREAYKLISSKKSRLSQAKFVEIAGKYPSGFKADITRTEIKGTQFSSYTVTTDIPLNLDKSTNTWKIDFTGEMDGQEKFVASKGSQ